MHIGHILNTCFVERLEGILIYQFNQIGASFVKKCLDKLYSACISLVNVILIHAIRLGVKFQLRFDRFFLHP